MGYYMCRRGGKRFVAAGSRPRNLYACTPIFPSHSLVRPLLGQAPNPVSCLTVVFRARCGLTSSRAYVLSGGCSALAVGRSALLRPSIGSLGGHPPQTPVSCLTVVFRARCGLPSSRAYVLSGGCSAGVIGRFCVGLSPRPAALRSAAFALDARPLAGCRPRPLFRLSVVLSHPCPDKNKCLLLSGALPPLTPARVAPAGGRCFSWYLCGLWPCAGNFAPVKFSRSSDKGTTAKPLVR